MHKLVKLKCQAFKAVRDHANDGMVMGVQCRYYWFVPRCRNCTDWRGGWITADLDKLVGDYVLRFSDNTIYKVV